MALKSGAVSARQPLGVGFSGAHPGTLAAGIWRNRELAIHLISRSLKAQYKGSFVGYGWILANPLLQFLVYNFVFSAILGVPTEGSTPFALVLFVGLTPWVFFSNTVSAASESIISGGSFVKAVYFPRELLVIAAVLTRLVDWVAGMLILACLFVYYGHPITWDVLWLPPMFFVYILFTFGLCLPLAALNLFFRDVRYLVTIALMLWFFLTPIVYPISTVPRKYLWIYELNPLSRFIGSFRYMLLQGVVPPVSSLVLAFVVSIVSLVTGYYLFKKMEQGFADRL